MLDTQYTSMLRTHTAAMRQLEATGAVVPPITLQPVERIEPEASGKLAVDKAAQVEPGRKRPGLGCPGRRRRSE